MGRLPRLFQDDLIKISYFLLVHMTGILFLHRCRGGNLRLFLVYKVAITYVI